MLEQLASDGGGKFYPADESKLVQILEEIAGQEDGPTRAKAEYWPQWKRTPPPDAGFGESMQALWGTPTPLLVLLFVALISTEWALRRKWGMA